MHARFYAQSLDVNDLARYTAADVMNDNKLSSDYPVNSQTRGLTKEASTGSILIARYCNTLQVGTNDSS